MKQEVEGFHNVHLLETTTKTEPKGRNFKLHGLRKIYFWASSSYVNVHAGLRKI